jgi:hypothetical protein
MWTANLKYEKQNVKQHIKFTCRNRNKQKHYEGIHHLAPVCSGLCEIEPEIGGVYLFC